MTRANVSFLCFTLGFLLTLGGVGGIETGETTASLISGVIVSGVGLLVMWYGTILMKQNGAV
jgi:uncharacterized membrane protein (UPF0136 family)